MPGGAAPTRMAISPSTGCVPAVTWCCRVSSLPFRGHRAPLTGEYRYEYVYAGLGVGHDRARPVTGVERFDNAMGVQVGEIVEIRYLVGGVGEAPARVAWLARARAGAPRRAVAAWSWCRCWRIARRRIRM